MKQPPAPSASARTGYLPPQQFRRLLAAFVVAVLAIVLATNLVVLRLRSLSRAAQERLAAVQQLDVAASRAAAHTLLTAETAAGSSGLSADTAVEQALSRLQAAGENDGSATRITSAWSEYRAAVADQAALLAAGNPHEARQVATARAQPAEQRLYNELADALVRAQRRLDHARSVETTATLAAVSAALAMLLLVLWRFGSIRRNLVAHYAGHRAATAAEGRLRSLVQYGSDLIIVLDERHRLSYCSPSVEQLLGNDDFPWRQRPLQTLVHPDDQHVLDAALNAVLVQPGAPRTCALRLRQAEGGWTHVSATVRNHLTDPLVGGVVINATDISERRRYEAQLMRLSNRDGLTGLYNRRRFHEEVEREIAQARRFSVTGALLLLDIDGFKRVNDGLGHRHGDVLLTTVAELLSAAVRDTDVVARLGGDEFAVLLPHTEAEAALAIARDLLAELSARTFLLDGHSVSITASIGVSMFPEHGENADDVVAAAGMAMYLAKETHGDVCLYRPDQGVQHLLTEHQQWEQRIRLALAQDRFILHAQPVQAVDGEIRSYELLIRMQADDGTLIPPASFLSIAERTGLIRAIDRWVIHQAVALIARTQDSATAHAEFGRAADELRRTAFSVNLSAKALTDPEMPPLIARKLAESGVSPDRLIIEITETSAIADMGQARQFVAELKRLGCRFALDDFGVGFSSFYYLKQLPVDYIKIDGSFIRNLTHDMDDQYLVRAIVEVARGLGKQTVAEFVGDEATVHLLRTFGVDHVQGYFIGRPRPLPNLLGNQNLAA